MNINIIVKQQREVLSLQWGVYNAPDGETPELIEGGFFSREAAEVYAKDVLDDCVASAERKAGWDGAK